jgi:hypothetical protein
MSIDLQSRGAAFKRQLLAEVREMVIGLLGTVNATVAAQQDGVGITNQHRTLNFFGPGVVVSDNAPLRRTDVFVPGGLAGASTTFTAASNTSSVHVKTLWNGSANVSPPASWYTAGFSEDGTWSTAVNANQTVGQPPPADTAAIWKTAAYLDPTEANIFRHVFSIPAGRITGATLTYDGDGYINDLRVNATTVATKLDTASRTGGRQVTISPSSLIAGANNIIAMQVTGLNPTSSWGAWRIDVTIASGGSGAFKRTKIATTGNKTTTSTTFVAIDNTNLPALSLTLAVGDVVRCILSGQTYNSSTNVGAFDAQVVQPTLGTVRANSSADFGAIELQGSSRQAVTMVTTFAASEAGSHTFQAVWRVNGGTQTLANASGSGADNTGILFMIENLAAPTS